jgi:ArsR family transcriptional regulator, arsenate/arsenite/antimonite-responsive transcriptional repressor
MMEELLNITRALSDVNRVRAVKALAGGELCLCEIIELLKLAPSTVSKHMAILHQAGLIETRKDGRWIFYRLSKAGPSSTVGAALALVRKSAAGDGDIRRDGLALRRIRRAKREELCACYHR